MGDAADIVEANAPRMRFIAAALDQQAGAADAFKTCLTDTRSKLAMGFETWPPAQLAIELHDELRGAAAVLRTRAEMAELADAGQSFEHLLQIYDSQLDLLNGGLDDGIGASGGDADRRAQMERLAFPNGVPAQPERVHMDPDAWRAENVTAIALRDMSGPNAAEYWNTLTDEQKIAAIVMAPATVGDRYVGDDISLADHEVFALQLQTIPDNGPQPRLPGTDYAGVPIPLPNVSSTDGPAPGPDDDFRSFAGDSWLCGVIQYNSILPSRPDSELDVYADTGKAIYDIGQTARTATTPLKIFSPSTYVATLADIGLCRLRVGSGAPISTNRVTTETGEVVYEDSQSQNPYQVKSGVPLHPDPKVRDEQVWYEEHRVENGNFEMYPEDQYPVYGPQE